MTTTISPPTILIATTALPLSKHQLDRGQITTELGRSVADADLNTASRDRLDLLRTEPPRWLHTFILVWHEPGLDAAGVLERRHGMDRREVMLGARALLDNLSLGPGVSKATSTGRVLHGPIFAPADDVASGEIEIELHAISTDGATIPSIAAVRREVTPA